jgi:thioredoxin-like negative regulator of GroEL
MSSPEFSTGEGNAPNREELLQLAINTARAGNKRAARLMFEQVLKQDKNNERAMMWLAKIAESKAERQEWLRRVLNVNPNNEQARDTLKRIAYRRSAKDNRVLLIFGVVAAVLIILAVVIVIAVLSGAR